MSYYNTGWINNHVNNDFCQDEEEYVYDMGGQVKNYEKHDVVAGQAYNIENQNYYDNYHHRYNHYYVTDNNYIQDHYMDYNVYHHDTNTVYNDADYHEAQPIFVDDDENNEYDRPYNNANDQVQENPNRKRKVCNNTTIRRIPCGESNRVWKPHNNCNFNQKCNCNNNNFCCNNNCCCNNNNCKQEKECKCTCKCNCKQKECKIKKDKCKCKPDDNRKFMY